MQKQENPIECCFPSQRWGYMWKERNTLIVCFGDTKAKGFFLMLTLPQWFCSNILNGLQYFTYFFLNGNTRTCIHTQTELERENSKLVL